MNKKTLFLLIFFINFIFLQNGYSQYIPYFSVLSNYIQEDSLNFSVKPYYKLNAFNDTNQSSTKSWLHRKIFNDHLIEFKNKEFYIRANYYVDFNNQRDLSVSNSSYISNTRGFNIEGKIGKLSFYTSLFEIQSQAPDYLNNYILKIGEFPGQGYNNHTQPNNYDFSYSVAGISYRFNKFFNIQLANDKVFIGDGYRSLLLSDNSVPYPFLRLTTNIGKFQLTNVYAEIVDKTSPKTSYTQSYKRKFFAAKTIEFKIKKWTFGIFETIIWKNQDSSQTRGFEWAYLNPIVFLRPVEYTFGSPDNAIIGIIIKNQCTKNTTIYAQIVLDEFQFKQLFTNNRGWWANKHGFQLGIKTKKFFGNPHLSALFEFNTVRPYTYSHESPILSYSNSNEPLAHPAGANFIEFVQKIDYAHKNYYLNFHFNFLRKGIDNRNQQNVGENILLNYLTRDKDYGNSTLQGTNDDIIFIDFKIGKIINRKNNLRVEFGYTYRNEIINFNSSTTANIFTFGIKSSFRNLYYDK